MADVVLQRGNREELEALLCDVFDPEGLESAIQRRLGVRLSDHVYIKVGMVKLAGDTVGWAVGAGRVRDLLKALSEEIPQNPRLQALVEQTQASAAPPRLVEVAAPGALEALTQRGDRFLNPERLAGWLTRVQGQVCQVRCGPEHGTGFLIDRDRVLTCYHVVAGYIEGAVSAAEVQVRFDYRSGPDGVAPDEGVGWRAIDPNFEVPSAPPSEADRTLRGDPAPEALDFAVLRLVDPPGDRGHLALPMAQPDPPPDTPVFVLGHPGRSGPGPRQRPLQLSLASPGYLGLNADRTRVLYSAPTLPGSSGSPVFDHRLQLIGLHHNRGPDAAPGRVQHNRGVAIARIAQALDASPRAHVEQAAEQALVDLFVHLFPSPLGLRRFLRRVRDSGALAARLRGLALDEAIDEVVAHLIEREQVDRALFGALGERAAPLHRDRIRAVARAWGVDAPGAGGPVIESAGIRLGRVYQWFDVIQRCRNTRHEFFLLHGEPRARLDFFTKRVRRYLNTECGRDHLLQTMEMPQDLFDRPGTVDAWETRLAIAFYGDRPGRAAAGLKRDGDASAVLVLFGEEPLRSEQLTEAELETFADFLSTRLPKLLGDAAPKHPIRFYLAVEEAGERHPIKDRLDQALRVSSRAEEGLLHYPDALQRVRFPDWGEVQIFLQIQDDAPRPRTRAAIRRRHNQLVPGRSFLELAASIDKLLQRERDPRKPPNIKVLFLSADEAPGADRELAAIYEGLYGQGPQVVELENLLPRLPLQRGYRSHRSVLHLVGAPLDPAPWRDVIAAAGPWGVVWSGCRSAAWARSLAGPAAFTVGWADTPGAECAEAFARVFYDALAAGELPGEAAALAASGLALSGLGEAPVFFARPSGG